MWNDERYDKEVKPYKMNFYLSSGMVWRIHTYYLFNFIIDWSKRNQSN